MTTRATEADDVIRHLTPILGQRLLVRSRGGFAAGESLSIFAPDGRNPALIARPISAAEVSAAVVAAAETGLPLAVRGGGHGYARTAVVDDGLVLDLRLMGAVSIDATRRVGTAAGGATAGSYTAAAGDQGLATGFGDTATVGVAGLALGGGIGYLSRRDGLTIDNLLGAEVVLADGMLVHTGADEHPDLFWALRGGGGNFGVVTSLDFTLHETREVTAGPVVFEPAAATVAALLRAAAEAPDTVSVMVNVMKAPPVPFLPVELHGTPIVLALLCHSGRPEDADAALAPFRTAGTVLADLARRQPYPSLFGTGPDQEGMHTAIRTGFGFDDARVEIAIELVRDAPTSGAVVSLRPMGGAIARVDPGATAFAHRRRDVMTSVGAVDPAPVGRARSREWAAEASARLGLSGAGYVNFMAEPDAAGDAYPEETLRRLAEAKRAYDPGDLFRSNVSIEPAASR